MLHSRPPQLSRLTALQLNMKPILLLFLSLSAALAMASQPSGCQICAATGQCNAAFHNGPGQYCGLFYDISISDNNPCCCPLQATCKVSPTQCKCHVTAPQQPSGTNNYYPSSSQHHAPSSYHEYDNHGSSLFGPLVFILVCICCCAFCSRKGDHHRDESHHHGVHPTAIPGATAVPGASCPAENPAYHSYGSTYEKPSSGGGGAGTAVASGLGGLAVGTILGDIIGRNTAQMNAPNRQQGGWFGGAGYDIIGDTGGGGYDIAGDTGDGGGGGYDIAGDS